MVDFLTESLEPLSDYHALHTALPLNTQLGSRMKINFPHVLAKFSLALNIQTSQLVKCCLQTKFCLALSLLLVFFANLNPNNVHNLIKSLIGKIFLFPKVKVCQNIPRPSPSSCHYHNRFQLTSCQPLLSSAHPNLVSSVLTVHWHIIHREKLYHRP